MDDNSKNKCSKDPYYKCDTSPYCKPPKLVEDCGPYQSPYWCDNCHALSNEYNEGKCPDCGEQLHVQPEDCYPWWLSPEHLVEIIPVCKQCGHRIRKNVPSLVGSVMHIHNNSKKTTPWNYNWNGKCEYCGHDYSIRLGIQIDDDGQQTNKKTTVSADCMNFDFPGCCDRYTVLSGVTIRTYVGEKACGEVFLSANELKRLMNMLKDSPFLEQYDYKFDPESY